MKYILVVFYITVNDHPIKSRMEFDTLQECQEVRDDIKKSYENGRWGFLAKKLAIEVDCQATKIRYGRR